MISIFSTLTLMIMKRLKWQQIFKVNSKLKKLKKYMNTNYSWKERVI